MLSCRKIKTVLPSMVLVQVGTPDNTELILFVLYQQQLGMTVVYADGGSDMGGKQQQS